MCDPFANIAHSASTPSNTIATASVPNSTITPTTPNISTRGWCIVFVALMY